VRATLAGKAHPVKCKFPIVAIILLLAWSSPASAQMSWKGLYAGADVSVGFRTLDFSVTDGYFRRTFSGAVD
jgi:hypothetical protein